MAESAAFLHGILYGDDWGVTFYGPKIEGIWSDFLSVSDRYIGPLFEAMPNCRRDEAEVFSGPKLAMEWNGSIAWAESGEICEVSATDAADFIVSLSALSTSDISPEVTWTTAEECIECAQTIRLFFESHLTRGVAVFIEKN
jgi:hypothetical protein